MWYIKYLFPIYYIYNYLNYFYFIKLNFLNFFFYSKIFTDFRIALTLFKLNSNFIIIIASYLNILINFCEMLPLSINFYFRYRNKHYVEFCYFYFKIQKFNYKIIFKIISELVLVLIKKIKGISFNSNYTASNNINFNLKFFYFFNKFELNSMNNFFFNMSFVMFNQLSVKTLNINKILFKFNILFCDFLRLNNRFFNY